MSEGFIMSQILPERKHGGKGERVMLDGPGPLRELCVSVNIINKPKWFHVSPALASAPHPTFWCVVLVIIPLQSHFTTMRGCVSVKISTGLWTVITLMYLSLSGSCLLDYFVRNNWWKDGGLLCSYRRMQKWSCGIIHPTEIVNFVAKKVISNF